MLKVGTLKKGFTIKTTLGWQVKIPRGTSVIAKTTCLYPEGVIQFKDVNDLEIFQMEGHLKVFMWGLISDLMPFKKNPADGLEIFPYPISMIVTPQDRR